MNAEVFRKYTEETTFSKIVNYGTVAAMWKHCLEEYDSRTAIREENRSATFREIEEEAAGLRTLLQKTGAVKGERIGLYAPNSLEFVISWIAITTAGYAAVILPPQLDEKAVFGCTMKYGLKALVYQEGLRERLPVTRAMNPALPLIACGDRAEEKTGVSEEICPEDPCVVMFTGGTTGRSKGALLSHRAVLQGTVNGCYGYREVFFQRYLLVLPLSHVFGLIRNLQTSLYTGSELFICRNNKDMFRNIQMFRPTILVVVPALCEMALTLSKKFGRNMLGEDMKYIICGAAMVAPYLIGEYRKFGITVFPGYGLTESANLVSGNPECFSKPDSVGIPYPGQELRIVNGELWLRGSNMMDGYLGEEDEKAWEDGWFRTGDLARFDEEGFLYITGRTKEVIVLPTGENISPAEVEARFNALPCVADCQVFEDVNEAGTHILALEAVPRLTELSGIPEEQVKDYVTEQLRTVNASIPSRERVSRIRVRDTDFERTPSMKIVRYHKCD